MKTGSDAHGTAENEFGSAKQKKRNPTPSASSKTGPGAQNMKTRADAVGTAQNEFGLAKLEK
jgi:TPP-dependent trihydroxycyclohexane-1,2-dione (THcHDO) dehydratase